MDRRPSKTKVHQSDCWNPSLPMTTQSPLHHTRLFIGSNTLDDCFCGHHYILQRCHDQKITSRRRSIV